MFSLFEVSLILVINSFECLYINEEPATLSILYLGSKVSTKNCSRSRIKFLVSSTFKFERLIYLKMVR